MCDAAGANSGMDTREVKWMGEEVPLELAVVKRARL